MRIIGLRPSVQSVQIAYTRLRFTYPTKFLPYWLRMLREQQCVIAQLQTFTRSATFYRNPFSESMLSFRVVGSLSPMLH